MKIFDVTIYKFSVKSEIKLLAKCEKILRSGGIIISPTDTVYGILGDATNAETIKKIFAMKQRPQEKAFPIFVKDIATARKYAYISDEKARFLEKVWPGAVTVVFQRKEKLPPVLTGGFGTIGIRIPDHEFLLKLLARLDFPLAQTSANVSGFPSAKSGGEAKRYFEKSKIKPDLVIDVGESKSEQSTIIDFTQKEPIILRTGLMSKLELDRFLDSMRS